MASTASGTKTKKPVNINSPTYKKGYDAGYWAGQQAVKAEYDRQAYWIMTKAGWVCSNCRTPHKQAHDDYCCKCGCKMSEEADCEM